MSTITSPPASYELPVSRGGDLVLAFRKEGGFGTASLQLVIEPARNSDATPIVADSTVSGDRASLKVESLTADTLKDGQVWRVIYRDGSLDVVIANGRIKRHDG